MAFAHIRANFDAMWASYPIFTALPSEISDYIAALKRANPGSNPTPCCLQLSWALNASGHKVPRDSFRRQNADLGRGGWGLGAVDEVEVYLTNRYGRTEDITRGPSGTRSVPQMREYIHGRQGILVFRDSTPGVHTELWDTSTIRQRGGGAGGMSEGYIFGQPRILFWEVANTVSDKQWEVPAWLRGWWYVTDGNDYWYYFSDKGSVGYVDTRPSNTAAPPARPENTGRVTVRETRPQVTIEWNPAGGGVTIENFTFWAKNTEMNGVSSRYAPLWAKKIS